MIQVNSVSEEYRYLSEHPCECGGSLDMRAQGLGFVDNDWNKPYDVLTSVCNKCCKEHEFTFDIKSFYDLFTEEEADMWARIIKDSLDRMNKRS